MINSAAKSPCFGPIANCLSRSHVTDQWSRDQRGTGDATYHYANDKTGHCLGLQAERDWTHLLQLERSVPVYGLAAALCLGEILGL